MPDLMHPLRAFGWLKYPIFFITFFTAMTMIAGDLKSSWGNARMNDMHLIGRDFVNIWHGGRLAVSAPPARVYDREDYRAKLYQSVGIKGIYAFSYPPHMLLASMPFGQMPYLAALAAWVVLTLGLFWHAARPWLSGAGLPSWSIFFLPATWINLWAGHFGFLIGALALYGWYNARTKPILSGAAFAVMTVKPHLGILVPPLLMARKGWAAFAWAGLIGTALIALSGVILGWDSWDNWIKSTLPFQAGLLDARDPNLLYFKMMPTVERFAAGLGLAGIGKAIVELLFAGSAVFLVALGWRKKLDLPTLGLLSIIATFLILPYAFNYDMVAFDVAILILATRISERLQLWEKSILAFAFLVPIVQTPMAVAGLSIAPIFILLTLWILVEHSSADEPVSA
jgi:alpha-1,2-mannosyltransferase